MDASVVAADDGEELAWDSAVGFELRREFPEGVSSITRPQEDFLQLRYAGLADRPEFLELIVRSKGKLENKPIIGTGDQICSPRLGELLRKRALPRLLITIDDGLKAEHLRCLENLGVPRLYLSLCAQPAPHNYRSCGGEEDLRVLAAAPASLAQRVRGVAVGLQTPAAWQHLRAFPNLSYLTVRGPAAGNFDPTVLSELCGRKSLVHLDIFDPAEITKPKIDAPNSCGLLRQSFEDWRAPTPVPGQPCNLRRLFVWNLKDDERTSLERACPALHSIEVVSSQKRFRR